MARREARSSNGATDPGELVLDPTCFRAGTRVKTESGWKEIDRLRPGERVWTHRGRLGLVVGVQRRPHTGRMVGVRLAGCGDAVWMTPEHRLLLARVPVTSPPDPLSACGEGDGREALGGKPQSAPHPLASSPQSGEGVGGRGAQLGGPATPEVMELARRMRQEATLAEAVLWEHLRARQLGGAKFRRQHPLGRNYIADFYCASARLVVEVDGAVHGSPRQRWADGIRQAHIQETAGLRVLRFTNSQVLGDLNAVLLEILEHVASPPSPLSASGEGDGREAVGGKPQSAPRPLAPSPRGGEGVGEEVWARAEDLRECDRVVGNEHGSPALIESIEYAHGAEYVYDLTVAEDHCFLTEAGVAHNCGSATTPYVAEQWGRRWITVDASRAALVPTGLTATRS